MSEWKECTIADLGEVVGGATPSTKKPENYENGDISWITPKDLSTFSGRFIFHGERNITEIGLNSCSTRLLPPNTVLFSSRAPIGYVAIAAKEMCTNQGFKSVIPNTDTDYMFLYYLLKYNRDNIENMGSGTTFKEVSGNTMKSIKVCVPVDIDEQRRIGAVLSAIDDKIELNTAINENLEQQAQALFKAHFGNNNLQTVRFGDIATFKYGKMPKKDKISVEGYPLFSGYQIVGYYPEKMFDEPQIIVVARGVGGCGDIKYTPSNCYLTNLSIAITSNDSAFEDYLYRLLKNTDMKILNTGSAQPQITVDSLQKFEIEIPSREDAMHYSSIITPIKIQYRLNNAENQHLAALRDTLLPKLMNGEIDVSEVNI